MSGPDNAWLPVVGDFRQWGPWIKHHGNIRPTHVRVNLIEYELADMLVYLTERGSGWGFNFSPSWDEITWYRLPITHPYYRNSARTPDPAQIRADAIREALAIAQEAVAKRIDQIEKEQAKPAFNIDVPQMMRWGAGKMQAEQIADEIAALLDTPLSPTAVDGSPAPDAGGKEGVCDG